MRLPDLRSLPGTVAPAAAPHGRGSMSMLIGVAAAAVLLLSLQLAAGLLVPMASALVLFAVLSAPAEALQRRGMPGALAAGLLVFVPALLLAGLGVALLPAAQTWWAGVPQRLAALASTLAASGAGAGWVDSARQLASRVSAAGGPGLLEGRALSSALGVATALMLSFFLLLAQRSLLAGLLAALPDAGARHRLRVAAHETRAGIATYFFTMLVVNAALGAAIGAMLAALRWPDAAAWAGATALLLFVPYLGPLAITLLLLGVAAGQHGATAPTLLPAGAFLLMHAIEANFVSPMLMGWRLCIGRPALIVAVMAGGWAWGVAGGVLAVPVLIAWRSALRSTGGPPWLLAALDAERAGAPPIAAAWPFD